MRLQFLASFALTLLVLLVITAIVSPSSFHSLLDSIRDNYQFVVILLFIAAIAILLRRVMES